MKAATKILCPVTEAMVEAESRSAALGLSAAELAEAAWEASVGRPELAQAIVRSAGGSAEALEHGCWRGSRDGITCGFGASDVISTIANLCLVLMGDGAWTSGLFHDAQKIVVKRINANAKSARGDKARQAQR